MKHQQVSVDFWAMGKSMCMYGVLTILGWMMLRLFNAVFMLPRRLRSQQETIQATLQEFQRRYPDLNVTEEDLKEAEKEIELWNKEYDEKLKSGKSSIKEKDGTEKNGTEKDGTETTPAETEDKKTI